MSDIEPDTENYHDTEEFDDFIEYNEEDLKQNELQVDPELNSEDDEEEIEGDRIRQLTTTLKPNETQTQKVLRAHISVLVSALGGPDHTSELNTPPYKLGQDALACLKDIKRWIKSVDERKNNYDVAMACYANNLVTKDLIVILCQWEQDMASKKPIKNKTTTTKIMLSCLELLVLLTWPIEYSKELSNDQKLVFADIKKAHLIYKKTILTYNNGQVLKAALRIVKEVIMKSKLDREPRDNQILKLVLFLFRNVLAIEPANLSVSSKARNTLIAGADLPQSVSQDDVSINNVLSVFRKNKVLILLLTISSNIGSEFDKEIFGELCLECIYLLVKGLEFKKVDKKPISIESTGSLQSVSSAAGMQLQDLLDTETKKKKVQTQNISTRHGRFGSLLSINANDTTSYVVSGQEALYNNEALLNRIDKSKQWKDRSHFKYDSDEYVMKNHPIYLNALGRETLIDFIDQFLMGGCFNNLVECMASKLASTTELSVFDEFAMASYFYTIAWFLRYQREKIEQNSTLNYGSVGGALSEINFILIISYFRQAFENKRWNSLHVAMVCFKELLQISHSIFGRQKDEEESQHEIDRELAEGIIRKLFSYNDFLNIIVRIPQTASKHSPEYLKVSISVVHILLKAFETFSNEDIQLYVQTKRRRNKNKRKRINDLDRDNENRLRDAIDASDDEFGQEQIKQVIRERKMNYKDIELKFFHQSIVTTYIDFLSRYEDLSDKEIKMCISYFHRMFVKRKDYSGLFRLDFMHLLQRLRNYLQKGSNLRLQVEEFIYYFNKKFKLALERFPNPLEILFPRFEELACKIFLAMGELYEKPENDRYNKAPRLAKELEFVRSFDLDEKIKILVSQLHLQQKETCVDWLIKELDRIINLRNLDPEAICELNPSKEHRRLIINNGYLRLLLILIGFNLPYTMEESPELDTRDNEKLTEIFRLIEKWNANQPGEFEDNKEPSYFLRTRESNYEDDEDNDFDGEYNVEPVENDISRIEFTELDQLDQLERQMNNPKRDVDKGRAKKKKKTHKSTEKVNPARRRIPQLLDDTQPVRSSEFIAESDDDSDDEKDNKFFAREERLRNLIDESGGIVNAAQLAEFKKIWTRLEKSTNKTKESVADAIKEISIYAQNDQPKDQVQEEKETNKRTTDESESESDSGSLKKRKRLVIEEDDDDD